MKRREDILQRLRTSDAVLEGATSVLPLVEITEDRRVLIEHHKGVIGYGCEEIRVKVAFGEIAVCGNALRLARMTGAQLVILGRITEVRFVRCGR